MARRASGFQQPEQKGLLPCSGTGMALGLSGALAFFAWRFAVVAVTTYAPRPLTGLTVGKVALAGAFLAFSLNQRPPCETAG